MSLAGRHTRLCAAQAAWQRLLGTGSAPSPAPSNTPAHCALGLPHVSTWLTHASVYGAGGVAAAAGQRQRGRRRGAGGQRRRARERGRGRADQPPRAARERDAARAGRRGPARRRPHRCCGSARRCCSAPRRTRRAESPAPRPASDLAEERRLSEAHGYIYWFNTANVMILPLLTISCFTSTSSQTSHSGSLWRGPDRGSLGPPKPKSTRVLRPSHYVPAAERRLRRAHR